MEVVRKHQKFKLSHEYNALIKRAVAGAECTQLLNRSQGIMTPERGLLHHFAHDLDWAFEIETFSRAHVQLQGDGIEVFLAVG